MRAGCGAIGRLAARLALALCLALGAAGASSAKPPMWIVRSKGATIVLFGSVHLLPAGLDWRPAALDDAIGKADELWFELPITAASDYEASVASEKRGELKPGQSLYNLLEPDQADKLKRVAIKLHRVPDVIAAMQPWDAELTLSVAEDAESGATAFNGVEEQIQAIAPLAARRVAFENAKQQIDFLAGAPIKDQLASLKVTLHEIEDDPTSYRRVVDEWMAADLVGLERDAITPLKSASPVLYDRLIAGRNRAWVKKLRKRLKKPGLTVVIVGVGHLIGPDGLPTLLRAKGVDVEAP
ncbi:MAG: TraB/GumN family protein [Caulobacterales bacterium]